MKKENAKILENISIAKDVYKMVLETSISQEVHPGQFVEVEVPEYFLRRPISVCRVDQNTLTLVYKVVGDGTAKMSLMHKDECLNLFGPLGTGFPLEDRDVLLIGGGVGVPPLLETAKTYREKNFNVYAVLGFNSAQDVILETEFKALGCETYTAAMDGSYGTKGTVLDAIQANNIQERFVLSCGPLPMLKAVSNTYTDGYVSLEARMACGMGACMGCTVKDEDGKSYRVCKDGPVFPIGKVVL